MAHSAKDQLHLDPSGQASKLRRAPPSRVVITGIGVISPIGLSLQEFGDHLFAGEFGVRTVSHLVLTWFLLDRRGA